MSQTMTNVGVCRFRFEFITQSFCWAMALCHRNLCNFLNYLFLFLFFSTTRVFLHVSYMFGGSNLKQVHYDR